MLHVIARQQFAVTRRWGEVGRKNIPSSLMINQFPLSSKYKHEMHHEVNVIPGHDCPSGKEVFTKSQGEPLTLEMTAYIEHPIVTSEKSVKAISCIQFYRIPFALEWVKALMTIFSNLPSDHREADAQISYQDIMDRRKDDKKSEPSNSTVMGESAKNAYRRFLKAKTTLYSNDHLQLLAPQWCHAIMASGTKSEIAQDRRNLFCAPEGLNIAMRTPEMMVFALAEHFGASGKKVHVHVSMQLFKGTSVLKSMKYRISAEDIKIAVNFDNPFILPNFQFENVGTSHLLDIIESSKDKRMKA